MSQLCAFEGKWEEEPESKQGFEEIAKTLGLPDDQKNLYKDTRTEIVYKRDGDAWSIDVGSKGKGKRTFSFKLGEEYQSADLDGTPMTSFVNSEDGETFVEKHTFCDGKLKGCEMLINRRVENGSMIVTTSIAGQSMVSRYKKE